MTDKNIKNGQFGSLVQQSWGKALVIIVLLDLLFLNVIIFDIFKTVNQTKTYAKYTEEAVDGIERSVDSAADYMKYW
jgi:hypothetical protein